MELPLCREREGGRGEGGREGGREGEKIQGIDKKVSV